MSFPVRRVIIAPEVVFMPNYKQMYVILVDAVEKVLDGVDRIVDEVNGRVEPDDEYFLQLKEDLTEALQKAEDIYIDTSEDK